MPPRPTITSGAPTPMAAPVLPPPPPVSWVPAPLLPPPVAPAPPGVVLLPTSAPPPALAPPLLLGPPDAGWLPVGWFPLGELVWALAGATTTRASHSRGRAAHSPARTPVPRRRCSIMASVLPTPWPGSPANPPRPALLPCVAARP